MRKKLAAIEITVILMGGGCVAKEMKEIESVTSNFLFVIEVIVFLNI